MGYTILTKNWEGDTVGCQNGERTRKGYHYAWEDENTTGIKGNKWKIIGR